MRYLVTLLVVGLAVLVHELGHFAGAKLLRFEVLRVSLGFGPPMWATHQGTTEYALGAVPFGGTVQWREPAPHATPRPWKKLLVLLGGPWLNGLFALGSLVLLHLSGTHVPAAMTLGSIEPGSPAAKARLQVGDVVSSLDGRPISQWSELVESVAVRSGRDVELGLLRDGAALTVRVRPRPDARGVGRLGVGQQYVLRRHSFQEALAQSVIYLRRALAEAVATVGRVFQGGGQALLTQPSSVMRQAAGGAVSGWDAAVRLFALVSGALAVVHLVPLPGLDGGRLLLTVVELGRGRRTSPRLEAWVHGLGFVAWAVLIAVAAGQELWRAIVSR